MSVSVRAFPDFSVPSLISVLKVQKVKQSNYEVTQLI